MACLQYMYICMVCLQYKYICRECLWFLPYSHYSNDFATYACLLNPDDRVLFNNIAGYINDIEIHSSVRVCMDSDICTYCRRMYL